MFLFFFNYLKTESGENSNKNDTNVSLDDRCSSIFWKNVVFQTNWFFEKTPFLKNLKKFIVIAPSITQILCILLKCVLKNCAKYEFVCKVMRVESRFSIDGVERIFI